MGKNKLANKTQHTGIDNKQYSTMANKQRNMKVIRLRSNSIMIDNNEDSVMDKSNLSGKITIVQHNGSCPSCCLFHFGVSNRAENRLSNLHDGQYKQHIIMNSRINTAHHIKMDNKQHQDK
jgi:hypothetical protein